MPIKVKPKIEPIEKMRKEIIKAHYSAMNKRRWAKVPAMERSEYMRRLVKLRWGRMSKKQRKEYMAKIGFGGACKRKADKK